MGLPPPWGTIHVYNHNIQLSSSQKPLDQSKSYRKHLYLGGTNVVINKPGHKTKMAAMPIYNKNSSKMLFSRTAEPIAMKLDMLLRLEYYNLYINHDPGAICYNVKQDYCLYLRSQVSVYRVLGPLVCNLVLRPYQDYFSSYAMGRSVGGATMGESREKRPGRLAHPQAELGLSHMCPMWDSNPHQTQQ